MFYHRYAEAMANLATKHGGDAKVKALAAKMKTAQAPEIKQMAGWLVGGKLPVPSLENGVVKGHSMAGMGGETTQMMSNQDMAALGKMSGSAFDRRWLQMMVKHHEGALVTAKEELAKGLNTGAKSVAQSVIDRHSAEIATMKSLLTGIPG